LAANLSTLIPVLVTGIQPRRVRAVNNLLRCCVEEGSLRRADARRLDPRHKGEDEGVWGRRRAWPTPTRMGWSSCRGRRIQRSEYP